MAQLADLINVDAAAELPERLQKACDLIQKSGYVDFASLKSLRATSTQIKTFVDKHFFDSACCRVNNPEKFKSWLASPTCDNPKLIRKIKCLELSGKGPFDFKTITEIVLLAEHNLEELRIDATKAVLTSQFHYLSVCLPVLKKLSVLRLNLPKSLWQYHITIDPLPEACPRLQCLQVAWNQLEFIHLLDDVPIKWRYISTVGTLPEPMLSFQVLQKPYPTIPNPSNEAKAKKPKMDSASSGKIDDGTTESAEQRRTLRFLKNIPRLEDDDHNYTKNREFIKRMMDSPQKE